MISGRSVALGASTPWKRIRCNRGRETSAASRCMNSSGDITMCVVVGCGSELRRPGRSSTACRRATPMVPLLRLLRSSHRPAPTRIPTINGVGRQLPSHHQSPKANPSRLAFLFADSHRVAGVCGGSCGLRGLPARSRPRFPLSGRLFSWSRVACGRSPSGQISALGIHAVTRGRIKQLDGIIG
jgi:hypothetical protein